MVWLHLCYWLLNLNQEELFSCEYRRHPWKSVCPGSPGELSLGSGEETFLWSPGASVVLSVMKRQGVSDCSRLSCFCQRDWGSTFMVEPSSSGPDGEWPWEKANQGSWEGHADMLILQNLRPTPGLLNLTLHFKHVPQVVLLLRHACMVIQNVLFWCTRPDFAVLGRASGARTLLLPYLGASVLKLDSPSWPLLKGEELGFLCNNCWTHSLPKRPSLPRP